MADHTGAATKERERKNIIDIDLYDRYVISGTGLNGEVFVLKSVTISSADTFTLTVP
jgi:hypothetical protein